jgi:hypothetical protein
MVIFALIACTSCKKGNKIIGEWKVISVEGDVDMCPFTGLSLEYRNRVIWNFTEVNYYVREHVPNTVDGFYSVGVGTYSIKYNTINFVFRVGGGQISLWQHNPSTTVNLSMKISFSVANKMKWKSKNKKPLIYIFEKIK